MVRIVMVMMFRLDPVGDVFALMGRESSCRCKRVVVAVIVGEGSVADAAASALSSGVG